MICHKITSPVLCLFIILLVQFGLLSGHLLGNSCPLGKQFVLIIFCLFVIFIYFPFWFLKRDLPFGCYSSCSLLFYYFSIIAARMLPRKLLRPTLHPGYF